MTPATIRASAGSAVSPQSGAGRCAAPGPNGVLRVLIADDHLSVREGLAAIVSRESDLQVVAGAANGRRAVEMWREQRPDVALIDIRMPELDGVGALSEIRAEDAEARIIMLTAFDDSEDIYRALRAGAKAYLLKEASREELLACIRGVCAGETYLPSPIAAKLTERMSATDLTGRENEVLAALARGWSNKEIGRGLSISEATVKTHIKKLYVKLRVLSRTEAIGTAARRGLIRL